MNVRRLRDHPTVSMVSIRAHKLRNESARMCAYAAKTEQDVRNTRTK
jgi:hypothetical protein